MRDIKQAKKRLLVLLEILPKPMMLELYQILYTRIENKTLCSVEVLNEITKRYGFSIREYFGCNICPFFRILFIVLKELRWKI